MSLSKIASKAIIDDDIMIHETLRTTYYMCEQGKKKDICVQGVKRMIFHDDNALFYRLTSICILIRNSTLETLHQMSTRLLF